MKVIYAFGDSITYGAWDRESSGWTALLRKHLDMQEPFPGFYFYNLGIHGETTDGLVKRFSSELEARRRHDDDDYTFIFAYGANDATWLTEKKRFKTSIEDYETNLLSVLDQAKKLTSKIYLLTTTPVNEESSANIIARSKSCLNKYVDQYNDKLREIASRTNAELIDINNAFKQQDYKRLLSDDGLHVNGKGHMQIFNQVKERLLTKI